MKKPVQDSTFSLMSSVEIVQRNHIFFFLPSSVSLVNACETVQRGDGVQARIFSSARRERRHLGPAAEVSLVASLDSSLASRRCSSAHLGIFS